MEEPSASTQRASGRAAADLNAAAIVEGCTVDISGVTASVRADGEARAAVLAAALGRLSAGRGEVDVEVSFGARRPRLPNRPPDESYAAAFHVWRCGRELFLAHGDVTAGHITETRARFGGAPSKAFRHLVPLALGHLLAFRDRFVVHAGVIARSGQVALIFGDSGSGKSTLVIAARAAGWRPLSDDLAIVRQQSGRVRAMTFGLPLVFPDDLLDQPLRGSRALAGDPRGRWALGAPRAGRWHTATAVLLPAKDASPGGSLTPVPALDVFEQAVAGFVAAPEPLLLRRYLPLAGAASKLPAWRLGLAPDPATRAKAAAQCLEQIVGDQP